MMNVASILENITFFKKDVISGKANKVGDKFTAMFMGMKVKFVVKEHHGTFFIAEMV